MPGPGVVVTTATRSGPTAPVRAVSGQFFVAGMTERGSVTEPIRISSMADYERFCGGRVTYGFLFDSLRTFFNEGGSRAWVARVVGPAAAPGTKSLSDASAVPTLRIDAANPGAWSSNLTVEVAAGSSAATYRIIVRLNGAIVEDATNLVSPAAATTYFAASPYIRAVDLGSATAAPNNNPAVVAASALSAGSDDRVSVVNATPYVDALDRFNVALGDGAVAIPGQTSAAVGSGIDEHCKATRRVGLLAGARGDGVNTLTTAANVLNSEWVGLFAPWVLVSDDNGGTRAIPPEGYVAAVRNRAHEDVGPWRAPAGRIAVARYVIGVDQGFSSDEGATLDTARVSAIRVVSGNVRLYGWRSLSMDTQNYSYLTGRDLLNRLVNEAEARLEDYVFSVIDGRGALLASINGEMVGLLDPIRVAGGLFEYLDETGDQIDPGYRVDTGSTVNTTASLANNEVRVRLAVRVSPVGALVSLTIVKVGVTAGL